jgi:hypothetical protein
MLHTKDPSSRFSKLFQVVIVRGDVFRSMTLVLGASRLLTMAKDIRGLHLIAIGEVFL